MVLKARVGRNTSKKKVKIANKVADQHTVIRLLNRIPVAKGGAEGMLDASAKPPVRGVVSQELYTAILYFQDNNFPAEMDGFISPGGNHLREMETLAATSRIEPAAKPVGWTDYLTSGSVIKGLNAAVRGDPEITLDEAVDIIAGLLSDGDISEAEIKDIKLILDESHNLSTAARHIIDSFYWTYVANISPTGDTFHLRTAAHQAAAETVCEFLKTRGTSAFPNLNRYQVGIGLLMRLGSPNIIYQGDASLCGPSTFLSSLATDDPRAYVRYALSLYSEGSAVLGSLKITPSSGCKSYSPPQGTIAHVDWLTAASLRDSENWFFDYSDVKDTFSGITLPDELRSWFRRAGFTDTRNETRVSVQATLDNLEEANELFGKDYRVCLFIDGDMLRTADQDNITTMPNHWIGLRSKVKIEGGNVTATVFTWGTGVRPIPQSASSPLSLAKFLGFYYGYVAARPLNS